MPDTSPQDQVLPCLLDRLIDDHPHRRSESRVSYGPSSLRRSLLRDLQWLFNAHSTMPREWLTQHPAVKDSVLNYGLEDVCGRSFHATDLRELEEMITWAIIAFEPRLDPDSLSVAVKRLEEDTSMAVFGVEIQAVVRALPTPETLIVRSVLDAETGKFELRS